MVSWCVGGVQFAEQREGALGKQSGEIRTVRIYISIRVQ